MNYKELNDQQKRRMNSIISNDARMEWEDTNIMYTLLGELPSVNRYQREDKIKKEVYRLINLIKEFNSFTSDREKFLSDIQELLSEIKQKEENWFGYDIELLSQCLKQQESCLISGEGGIGKSYFIKCYQEELEKRGIPHLCLYGKFQKDVNGIDIDEIIHDSKDGFVFVFDAINEMAKEGQLNLISLVRELKKQKTIRIVVTYRTNTLDKDLLEQLQGLCSAEYEFPGVSYESALDALIKLQVIDIYKYEDILYSNNALFLSMLLKVLNDKKVIEETENSVSTITYIMEKYIKDELKNTCKTINTYPAKDYWEDTKIITTWMYKNEKTSINLKDLLNIVHTGKSYLDVMCQSGLMDVYTYEAEDYAYFTIESMNNFLIARELFKELPSASTIKSSTNENDFNKQVELINSKAKISYGLIEPIIIALFDKYADNYLYLSKLLKEVDFKKEVTADKLVRVNFREEKIKSFLDTINLDNPDKLIGIFGGYNNKPFNCTHFLNKFYKKEGYQIARLSATLSDSFVSNDIVKRLKNILYFIGRKDIKNKNYDEAFYFALWCTASPQSDIRIFATKLLFEIVNVKSDYAYRLISEYKNLYDIFIKEAVILVLAYCPKNDKSISDFFKELMIKEESLTAKSIKRISSYLNNDYGYIEWDRDNMLTFKVEYYLSDFIKRVLHLVGLLYQFHLPFVYRGNKPEYRYYKFLSYDKADILDINQSLEKKYSCARNGRCSGHYDFENLVKEEALFNRISSQVLDVNILFSNYVRLLTKLIKQYQIAETEKNLLLDERNFENSTIMKCVDISTGLIYGSLMCNYYTDDFSSYNNIQNSIGYDVYDPLPDGEDICIATPIPIYNEFIDKAEEQLLNSAKIPEIKDINWIGDCDLSRKNLLELLNPVLVDNVEWSFIAGSISLTEKRDDDLIWRDVYDIYCCTSDNETIKADGNARYLSIELKSYEGNFIDYQNCQIKPWLCKKVSGLAKQTDLLDETWLVLPPAEIISFFQLQPDLTDMTWNAENGDIVIVCNNNKNSYYNDPVSGSVFIRNDYLKKYKAKNVFKYFAFTERYQKELGFDENTSLHYEIRNNRIVKEIKNEGRTYHEDSEQNQNCASCPYGMNTVLDRKETPFEIVINWVDPSDHIDG